VMRPEGAVARLQTKLATAARIDLRRDLGDFPPPENASADIKLIGKTGDPKVDRALGMFVARVRQDPALRAVLAKAATGSQRIHDRPPDHVGTNFKQKDLASYLRAVEDLPVESRLVYRDLLAAANAVQTELGSDAPDHFFLRSVPMNDLWRLIGTETRP